jgi:hypothetical protein
MPITGGNTQVALDRNQPGVHDTMGGTSINGQARALTREAQYKPSGVIPPLASDVAGDPSLT